MMPGRPYQEAAIAAIGRAAATTPRLRGVVVAPTGSGKSWMIAEVARRAHDRGRRVLVVTHVQELIAQLEDTMHRHIGGELGRAPVSIYSAGLGRKELDQPIVIAGIQSLHHVEDLPHFDRVMIDEAHLIPKAGTGMYRTLLARLTAANPEVMVIGFTATPFRLDSGSLVDGEDRIFDMIIHDIPMLPLIEQGFLCPLVGRRGKGSMDTSELHVRAGEFVAAEVEAHAVLSQDAAIAAILSQGRDRQGWIVFAAGVGHATTVCAALQRQGVAAALVTGDTPDHERAGIIARFKARELRCIVNVGVLTTGFDAPHVDLVALLRPTMSPGLYAQMAGRGLRTAAGKSDCLILDMGGNIERHGPLWGLRVSAKASKGRADVAASPLRCCEGCDTYYQRTLSCCPACGWAPPAAVVALRDAPALGPLDAEPPEDLAVEEMDWLLHEKRNDPTAPRSVRVSYRVGLTRWVDEWVSVGRPLGTWPRTMAEGWWGRHTGQDGSDCPRTAEAAIAELDRIRAEGGLIAPTRLTVGRDPKNPQYERIVGRTFPAAPIPADCPF